MLAKGIIIPVKNGIMQARARGSVDIGTGHVLGRDSLGQSKDLDRRCDVLGHLGHIYNIYIYPLFGKLIIKLKSNYMIILLSNGPILMNIFLFCSSY